MIFFSWSAHLRFGNSIVFKDFSSLCLGPCCTYPICCVGRGRFREGVWSTQPAQDWLWPGGPPHTSKSRIWRSFLVLDISLENRLCCTSHFLSGKIFSPLSFSPETGICWCGYRIPGTGSCACLWNGLHWEKLWQIQVSVSRKYVNSLTDSKTCINENSNWHMVCMSMLNYSLTGACSEANKCLHYCNRLMVKLLDDFWPFEACNSMIKQWCFCQLLIGIDLLPIILFRREIITQFIDRDRAKVMFFSRGRWFILNCTFLWFVHHKVSTDLLFMMQQQLCGSLFEQH